MHDQDRGTGGEISRLFGSLERRKSAFLDAFLDFLWCTLCKKIPGLKFEKWTLNMARIAGLNIANDQASSRCRYFAYLNNLKKQNKCDLHAICLRNTLIHSYAIFIALLCFCFASIMK